jgi:hypothetical protein
MRRREPRRATWDHTILSKRRERGKYGNRGNSRHTRASSSSQLHTSNNQIHVLSHTHINSTRKGSTQLAIYTEVLVEVLVNKGAKLKNLRRKPEENSAQCRLPLPV